MDLGAATMADQSFLPDQAGHDDIDFTFEDGGADQAELDFDFEIGDGTAPFQSEAQPDVPVVAVSGSNEDGSSGHSIEQAEATHQADAAVLDEIDYEEADEKPVVPDADHPTEPTASHTEDMHKPESNPDNGDDEINYEEDVEDELGFSAEPDKAAQQVDIEIDFATVDIPQQGDETQMSNEADYATSNPAGESTVGGYSGTGLDILDATLTTGGLEDMAGAAQLEGNIANGFFGNKIASDLNQGLSQLDGLFTTTRPSVTVTWGQEVCPLFKASKDDDPTSFYLDDVAVLNLPLSAFLAGIRKNISSWVDDDDEIHIRIDELELEFSETTTEALLGQVTFAQLVALHNTLLKNEDPEASRGFNLTLTTRPNCTFRLKELVEGANSGKGLSIFQSKPTPSVSSSTSEANEVMSDGVSPAEEEFDEAADRESSHEQDEEAAEAQAYSEAESEADEDEDDIVDYEEQDDGEGDGDGEDDADEHNAEDELDLITYTNGEETGQQNAGTDASNQDNDEATYTAGFEESADDLLSYDDDVDIAQGANDGDSGSLQATRSQDPSQGLDYSQSATGHENDDTNNDMAYLDLDHDDDDDDDDNTAHHDDALYGDDQPREEDLLDDEYLDLEGDAGQGHVTDKVTTQDVQNPSETQGQSSTTSTVNGDEIDYEDHPAGNPDGEIGDATHDSLKELGNGDHNQQAGLDEIDWEDEDKIIAPHAPPSPSTSVTGKRSREDDEADELVDEGHDNKRHRHEPISS